jgi:hypothetical protein
MRPLHQTHMLTTGAVEPILMYQLHGSCADSLWLWLIIVSLVTKDMVIHHSQSNFSTAPMQAFVLLMPLNH